MPATARLRTILRVAEATVAMGDGVVRPYITALRACTVPP